MECAYLLKVSRARTNANCFSFILYGMQFTLTHNAANTRSVIALASIVSTISYSMSEFFRTKEIKALHNVQISIVFAHVWLFPILIDESSNLFVHINA